MTHEEHETKLLEAMDRISILEAQNKQLVADVSKIDKCPDCRVVLGICAIPVGVRGENLGVVGR